MAQIMAPAKATLARLKKVEEVTSPRPDHGRYLRRREQSRKRQKD